MRSRSFLPDAFQGFLVDTSYFFSPCFAVQGIRLLLIYQAPGAFASQGCHNKSQVRQMKTRETSFSQCSSGCQGPKSRCWWGQAPLNAQESPSLSLQLQGAPGFPQFVEEQKSLPLSSDGLGSCASESPLLPLTKTRSLGLGPTVIQYNGICVLD